MCSSSDMHEVLYKHLNARCLNSFAQNLSSVAFYAEMAIFIWRFLIFTDFVALFLQLDP